MSWSEDISDARGELAKYMSELESNQKPCAEIGMHGKPVMLDDIVEPLTALCNTDWYRARSILRGFGVERASQVPTHKLGDLLVQIHEALHVPLDPRMPAGRISVDTGGIDSSVFAALHARVLSPKPIQETPMNETDKAEAGPIVEKTRSQLLGEAASELLQAQCNLERIQDAPEGTPETVAVSSYPYSPMADAISSLVKEQWSALVKKAVARAKARVAKAEKAVGALLS